MADRYYGPFIDGAAETITGVARSAVANIGSYADKYIEIATPAGFDRSIDFQITFDDPSRGAPTTWIDAQYVDRSSTTSVPAVGSFAPGANVRKLYKILDHGRGFSINVTGGTTGNLSWRLIALASGGSATSSGGGGTGTSASQVQGTVASGATDANNPVKVGWVYNTTLPTVTNGQRVDAQGDANGRGLLTLGTALSGEDFTNGRFLQEAKPADTDSVLETLQNAAGATGNGAAANVKGYKSLSLDVTISATATVTFEATIDDSTWTAIGLAAYATGTVASTATATGSFYLPAGSPAFSQFRARISAWTSGTVTCKSRKHPR